jgi:hypothetical protein
MLDFLRFSIQCVQQVKWSLRHSQLYIARLLHGVQLVPESLHKLTLGATESSTGQPIRDRDIALGESIRALKRPVISQVSQPQVWSATTSRHHKTCHAT